MQTTETTSQTSISPADNGADRERFGGVERLYGSAALDRFQAAHVAIIGLGGVGSWTAEALARSGVGTISLIDLDDICVTNTNRQVHTLQSTVGQPKIEALRLRLIDINPGIKINTCHDFLTRQNAVSLLSGPFQCVVDAIDQVGTKALILHICHSSGMAAVTVGGAGGRRDPAAIRCGDLTESWGDELLKLVRKKLRRDYGFPNSTNTPFGIPSVYSHEPRAFSWSDGRICSTPEPGSHSGLDCASGFGTVCHITATFGLFAASHVLDILCKPSPIA
jgi:tRNA A37 threonylcarbamoyladenosine dehydratase